MNSMSISSARTNAQQNPSFSGIKNLPGLLKIGTFITPNPGYSDHAQSVVGHDTLEISSKTGNKATEKMNVGIIEEYSARNACVDPFEPANMPTISIVKASDKNFDNPIAQIVYGFDCPEKPVLEISEIKIGNKDCSVPAKVTLEKLMGAIAQMALKYTGGRINLNSLNNPDLNLLRKMGFENDEKVLGEPGNFMKVSGKLEQKLQQNPVIDMSQSGSFNPEN